MDVNRLNKTISTLFIMMFTLGMTLNSLYAEEATHDNYFVLQSVTLNDANDKATGFHTSGISSVLKTANGKQIDYEIWTQGSANSGQEEMVLGPVQFTRNPKNEEVSFKTTGLGLVEDVVNRTLKQVRQNSRKDGTWDQELVLNLLGSYLPGKVVFHFNVQKVGLKKGVNALFIRAYSDMFRIKVLPDSASDKEVYFYGIYKGAYIYSPEEHVLYQMTSVFGGRNEKEIIRIEDAAFLAGPDGKPAYPLIDLRETLEIQDQDQPEAVSPMPRWAMQAVKVQQAVGIAAVTTAERASNPAILPIISQIVEIDGFAGVAGLPSSSSLIEEYGETQAGEGGKLAGRFFSTVGSEALGAVLPETALATAVPAIPALMTAYSVYTMYGIAAEVTGMAFAAELGKLTPFNWPKVSLDDEALKAFDLKEPIGQVAEPEIPEVGGSSGFGKTALWIGTGGAVAAGVALGLAGADSLSGEDDDEVSDECKESYDYIDENCCVSSGGIQTVAITVPQSCGCPEGTTDIGDDLVTAGGPYDLCDCNCN